MKKLKPALFFFLILFSILLGIFLRAEVFPRLFLPAYDERWIVRQFLACQEKEEKEHPLCYQEFFAGALKSVGLSDLAKNLEEAMGKSAELRYDCHQVVHALGRAAFNHFGSLGDAFREGENLQFCAGGFFHGAVEALFRGGEDLGQEHISLDEMKEKIPALCGRYEESKRKDECLHGIGHGVLYFLNNDLEEALSSCELLKPMERFSCYTGVFMENLLSANVSERKVSKDDLHIPCKDYSEPYKSPCYYVHSFRFKEAGLPDNEIVAECKKAGGVAGTLCLRGFGIFFLAHEALAQGFPPTVSFCESLGSKEGRVCAEAVAARLASLSEDGSSAMPFCALFKSAFLKQSCFSYAVSVLQLGLDIPVEEIRSDCERYATNVEECSSAIKAR